MGEPAGGWPEAGSEGVLGEGDPADGRLGAAGAARTGFEGLPTDGPAASPTGVEGFAGGVTAGAAPPAGSEGFAGGVSTGAVGGLTASGPDAGPEAGVLGETELEGAATGSADDAAGSLFTGSATTGCVGVAGEAGAPEAVFGPVVTEPHLGGVSPV